ncbi:glucose/galactose MFS transporter, partial [Dyella flava]|nr:glucose/galactose MFS transporter [Dyella flava]
MSSTTYTADAQRTSTLLPMTIIGVLFFIMGFFTWLNGPLISFVKVAFTLDDINAFLV